MSDDERAALVKRLRSRDAEDVLVRDFKATADLIEADGKRLADLAEDRDFHRDHYADLNRLWTEEGKRLTLAEDTIAEVRLQAEVPMRAFDDPDNYRVALLRVLDNYYAAKEAGL